MRVLPSLIGIPVYAKHYASALLAVCCVLSAVATLYRLPTVPPRPYRSASRIIRAGIWTVHFGIDNAGRDSQRGMRSLIHDMELDIVGLLETDLHVSQHSDDLPFKTDEPHMLLVAYCLW
jgi:hypothetical protein